MQNLILDMPREAAAQLNYMMVLASCENYHIPTCPSVSVEELISSKLYSWYTSVLNGQQEQIVSWYTNYE
jgi:hypothetical protein